MRPIRLLQITDCHLGSERGDQLLGLDTDQSFRDVLNDLAGQDDPDIIVCTGDISNDSSAQSYQRFVDITKEYFPTIPLAWLPGNHDDPLNMDLAQPSPIEAAHRIGGWNLIFLDSRIPMEEGGNLPPRELVRLRNQLNEYYSMPTIVFMHHQPVPVGSTWLDTYVINNAQELFAVVEDFPNVRALCWGHVHQAYDSYHNDIRLLATPSTCVQFKPLEADFTLDTAMPGYRFMDLYSDGRLETMVSRVKDKRYEIDFASLGY